MPTTLSNPGRLLSASFNSTSAALVPLTGGTTDSPTAITPQDADVTVVLATVTFADPPENTVGLGSFKLDSSFAVGAVVEIYYVGGNGPAMTILDENGNQYAIGNNHMLRKIATGSGKTWGHIYSTSG
jgi:hypothetical protein